MLTRYLAYQWIANQEDDYATNQKMLQHSIATIDALSSCLQFVVLVTGAKVRKWEVLFLDDISTDWMS